jgi:AcrR family transcriptional regulator
VIRVLGLTDGETPNYRSSPVGPPNSAQGTEPDSAVRDRLLDAAEELFGTRSFERTKVADLAEAAGIATGSFYSYFPGKRALLVEVLRRLSTGLRAAMGEAIQGAATQADREREAFVAFFRFLERHPRLFRIQRQVEFLAPEEYRSYWEGFARRYARAAKDAMVAGEMDARFDPDVVAYTMYLGVPHFIGMRWVEWSEGRVPDDVAEQIFLLLNKALRPPPGGA